MTDKDKLKEELKVVLDKCMDGVMPELDPTYAEEAALTALLSIIERERKPRVELKWAKEYLKNAITLNEELSLSGVFGSESLERSAQMRKELAEIERLEKGSAE